jgi:galactokinase
MADEALNDVLARAIAAFEARFGRRPTHAATAPGRVNLIGEHTDYNEGFALPLAIDRWTAVVAAPADRKRSSWFALDLDAGAELALAQPLTPLRNAEARFANYPLGVVKQFAHRGVRVPEFDAVFASSIPIGAGLSSSASVEVATATLLEAMTGCSLSSLEKARLCQRAEHEFVGTPCGIMDMLAIVNANKDHALLLDCRCLECRPVPLPPAHEAAVLVVDSGVKRELASSAYTDRRACCEAAARALGLASLRDMTINSLGDPRLSDEQRRRAKHVIEENQRTLDAAAALECGDLESLGSLMFASHESLRDLYDVSCPELNEIVETARSIGLRGGVLGARMTGGGFGGCAIILCRTSAVPLITEHVQSRFAAKFDRIPRILPP